MILGAVLFIAGLVTFLKSCKHEEEKVVYLPPKNNVSSTDTSHGKTSGKEDNSPSSQTENPEEPDSYAKGLKFEKYVVGKFSKKYWKIKDWRSDKGMDDRYAESSKYPDLEMELDLKGSKHVVAIECKWRSGVKSDGKIKWSYPEQRKRYLKYQQETGTPVFVAIGVGGTPDSPKKVYIVPLAELNSCEVNVSDIDRFYHSPESNFFYDADKNEMS